MILTLLFALSALANPLDTFRARLTEDLATLDWNYGEVNHEVVLQLMEGLFTTDPKGRPEKALADSFRWKNSRELEVRIKKAEWSDGTPLCAKHFVDSWNRLRDPKFASPYAHYANVLKAYEAKSCDRLEIRFTRAAPEATALLAHWVFFPVRLDVVEKNPKLWTEGVGLPVTGPFLVASWKKNQSVRLAPNGRYHGKKPRLRKVEFLFLPDENTAKLLFDKGELDWLKELSPLLRTPTLEKSPAFRVFPTFVTYYFGLNSGKSRLLEDPVIRHALSASLKRSELPRVLGREARPTETWLAEGMVARLRAPDRKADLALAAKRLRQAAREGRMDLVLRTYNKAMHKLLAEWAQGQWLQAFGVRIPIEVQEGKIYWKEITTNPPPIYFSGVTAPYGHPRAFLQEFLATSTANWTGWTSAQYDAAVNRGAFQEAEDILAEAGYIVPVYARDTAVLIQPKWKRFHLNPLGQAFLRDLP